MSVAALRKAGGADPSDATPPRVKIHQFSKIYINLEPFFFILMSLTCATYLILKQEAQSLIAWAWRLRKVVGFKG